MSGFDVSFESHSLSAVMWKIQLPWRGFSLSTVQLSPATGGPNCCLLQLDPSVFLVRFLDQEDKVAALAISVQSQDRSTVQSSSIGKSPAWSAVAASAELDLLVWAGCQDLSALGWRRPGWVKWSSSHSSWACFLLSWKIFCKQVKR